MFYCWILKSARLLSNADVALFRCKNLQKVTANGTLYLDVVMTQDTQPLTLDNALCKGDVIFPENPLSLRRNDGHLN